METFADVIEQFAPLGKGHITTRQNIQIHHIPLADAAEFIRQISEAGLSSREGCGNTIRNVTGDPWAGVSEDEPFDITPYAAAYVRYFVRHPTTQLMPRKVKTAFTRHRRRPGDHRHPRRRLHPQGEGGGRQGGPRRRGPDRRRHLDHAPRRPHPLRVRRARQRRLPEGDRGRAADLRPPGLAAREPDARPDQGAGRQDRDGRLPRDGRGGAEGRLGQRARLLDRPPALRRRRGGQRPGGPRELCAQPNGDTHREFDRFREAERRARSASEGFSTVQVRVIRGDLTPRAVPRAGGRSCATSPAATPARPCSRTWCCAGSATSRSTTSGSASASWAWTRPAPTRSPTWSAAPAPTPASSASPARWG